MNYQQFRDILFKQVCFSSNQVYAWQPGFNKNNLNRWVKKGYLIKLRNGFYSFPEYLEKSDYALFIANRIYRPSYVSLHTALAFYGLIPEAVIRITSVTTLKTKNFKNKFGSYFYQTIHPGYMFGYEQKILGENLSVLLAEPEKAILDLLYLYPFYNSRGELEALRLDIDIFKDMINVITLEKYTQKFQNRNLENRIRMLIEIYNT